MSEELPAPRASGTMESRAALEEKIMRQMVEVAERIVGEFNLQIESIQFNWYEKDLGGGVSAPRVRRVNLKTNTREYIRQR